MSKYILLFLFMIAMAFVANAQTEDAKKLHENAKAYMREGDYDNAILVMNRALAIEPNNLEMMKDLEFIYYLKRDYALALETGKKLIERPDADQQTFQLLGLTYKAIAEYKECRKLYKRALDKYPNSGAIYNEYGELLGMDNDADNAITLWEKGIEVDASYSGNYYNAVKYYAQQPKPDLFWILMYGEIFVNIESYTARTAEMKKILLEGYKKIYASGNLNNNIDLKKASDFEKEVISVMNKSNSVAATGINVETLISLRARFVLEWFAKQPKYAFRLFEHHQHLLKEGLFDAYNQWIFGSAISPSTYELWVKEHDKESAGFKKFQEARVFKIPSGQYYK